MRHVQFVLLREGSSDNGLAVHLESLLIKFGAQEVLGEIRPYAGTTQDKLDAFLAEGLDVDVIFLHRDADNAGHTTRETEIFEAAQQFEKCPPVIPVVPTTMTESWLLTDEQAIRDIARAPRLRHHLHLGPVSKIEEIADAKKTLKETIALASQSTGSELRRLNARFDANRATLLSRLDPDGPVRQLPSWLRLEEDILSFIERRPRSGVVSSDPAS
jgi:hypothetical protein